MQQSNTDYIFCLSKPSECGLFPKVFNSQNQIDSHFDCALQTLSQLQYEINDPTHPIHLLDRIDLDVQLEILQDKKKNLMKGIEKALNDLFDQILIIKEAESVKNLFKAIVSGDIEQIPIQEQYLVIVNQVQVGNFVYNFQEDLVKVMDQMDNVKQNLEKYQETVVKEIDEIQKKKNQNFQIKKTQNYEGGFLFNCRKGYGIFHNHELTYKGQFQNDQYNGLGQCIWQNGIIYNGNWKNHKANGQGEVRLPDGTTYTGNFIDGRKEGYGEQRWANGEIYSGNWKNNQYHGEGTYQWPSGTTYQGFWINDELDGPGLKKYPGGETKEEIWRNGVQL